VTKPGEGKRPDATVTCHDCGIQSKVSWITREPAWHMIRGFLYCGKCAKKHRK
jgi:hypothetical protein